MLKSFNYTKENGDKSRRTVFQLMGTEDRFFCIDLTEFDAQEQDDYLVILNELHDNYIEAIKEVGLGSTFRTFLYERVD